MINTEKYKEQFYDKFRGVIDKYMPEARFYQDTIWSWVEAKLKEAYEEGYRDGEKCEHMSSVIRESNLH